MKFRSVIFLLALSILYGCSSNRGKFYRKSKKIDRVKSTYYSKPDSTFYVSGISIQGNVNYDEDIPHARKDIQYNRDMVWSINYDYFLDSGGEFITLSKEFNNDSSIYVQHGYWDTSQNTYYQLELNYDDGVLISELEINFDNEDSSHMKMYTLSEEVINYYHELSSMLIDSVDYLDFPEFPDISGCNSLIRSNYSWVNYLNDDSTSLMNHYLDSIKDGNNWKVKSNSIKSYIDIEVNDDGMTTLISKRPYLKGSLYWKKEYYQMYNDLYQLCFIVDTIQKDTTYWMEMTSEKVGNNTLHHYKIRGNSSFVSGFQKMEGDKRIPIVEKEFDILRDKNTRLLEVHAKGVSEQGHPLEVKYSIDKKNNATYDIKKNTIPNVSGDQIYILEYPHNLMYLLPGKAKYRRLPKESRHYSWWHNRFRIRKRYRPEYYHEDTERIERNRKEKYEKRIKQDKWSKSVYEIYYQD